MPSSPYFSDGSAFPRERTWIRTWIQTMNTNMNAVPVTSEKVRTSSGEQPTTIDSKLCRPFRRFDRFYSGERKPGDDASD